MWARHHKTPGWFRKLPRGEQIFLVAADMWAIEDENKPRSSAGVTQNSPTPRVNTMSLQQFAKLR